MRYSNSRPNERKAIRQEKTKPIADALHQWLTQQRQKVPDGSATAKGIDYSLKRWDALTLFINGHDPYAYLKDVLERLPLQPASRIQDLLPSRWRGLQPGCITNATRPGSVPP